MGCFNERPETKFNFISAQRANNVLLTDEDVGFCSISLSAPSSFIAVRMTGCDVDLFAVDNNGGSATGFEWQRSTVVDSGFVTIATTLTPEYSDTNLTTGTYYYRVRATGLVPSPYSLVSSVVIPLQFEAAIQGSGVNEYVYADPSTTAWPISDDFTVSIWYKFTELFSNMITTDTPIMMYRIDMNNYFYFSTDIAAPTGGKRKFNITSVLAGVSVTSSFEIDDDVDVWHNFVITYESVIASPNLINAYVDGVNVLSDANTNSTQQGFLGNVYLGWDAASNYSIHAYDEFIHVDGKLTSTEVSDYYNDGNGSIALSSTFEEAISYNFNEGVAGGDNTLIAAPEITDGAGYGHDGTLVNFAKIGSTSNFVEGKSPVPTAEVTLSVELTAVDEATLTYSYSTFDSETEIWRSDNGGAYALIDTVAVGSSPYVDPNFAIGLSEYKIKKVGWTCFSQSVSISTVSLSTNWNDATVSDGAFTLNNLFSGGGSYKWFIEGGNTYATEALSIPADTGDLDGTTKNIVLAFDESTVVSKTGAINWGSRKIIGAIDLTGYKNGIATTFDVRFNSGISSLTIPTLTMTGLIRITDTLLTSLDFSNVTINQTTNVALSLHSNTSLTSITFKSGGIKTGGGFYIYGNTSLTACDLSGFSSFALTEFHIYSTTLLTSILIPTTWSASGSFLVYSTGLTSFDVSGLTITGSGTLDIRNNSALTSITFGATSWIRSSVLNLHSNNITGTLNTSACTIDVTQWESHGNSLMTDISFNASTKFDRLRSYNCDLGYIDLTGVFNDWDNIISINLSGNSMTAAEVNHYLVDMDGQVTAGTYTVDISGSNAAPDGTSGGFDGLTAKTSLQGKGLTMTTS